tara:strand:- start:20696 stop:26272 length:5577 start_codon:yes stop_codon:yes gene_type:complete
MPKELNLSANERIDLEDFQYGTRTFTVDSLRAHVQRLLSGGYRGGFVLEGFRVEIPSEKTDMEITVYNGIALDRGGRIVSYEEGNLFLNNPKTPSQTVPLLDGALKNYVTVEFTLQDADNDQRAFWDPTYENSPIKDSASNDVPQPKGKEFTITVPTRKAQSWRVDVSATGFEDSTDPNKLRIPIAIIPVDIAVPEIDLGASDLELASTTCIEQPIVGTAATDTLGYVRCANTRLFPDAGTFELYDPETNVVRAFAGGDNTLQIVNNDRENNILYVKTDKNIDSAIQYTAAPRVGDVVRLTTVGEDFLAGGSKYDCRPMFFSFTDDVASTSELTNPFTVGGLLTGDRYTATRNNRYWASAALLTNPSTTGDTTVNYPSTNYGQQKGVSVPANRVENRLKQQQDFFRALSAILQESKYGLPYDIDSTASETTVTSSTSTTGVLYTLGIRNTSSPQYIVDTTKYFSQSLIGSYVQGTDSSVAANYGQRRIITDVLGSHVLVTDTWPATWESGKSYRVEVNYPNTEDPTLRKQFVDTRYTGSLGEVYDGRVDQFTNSYAEDLNRRFSVNKVATITVGDGINTHGDFTGGTGIIAAFALAYAKKRGAHIHIKRGTYYVPCPDATPILIGPNTTVTGEGKGATVVKLLGSGTNATSTPNYFLIRDYYGEYATAPLSSYEEIVCKNIKFKDLTLESADQTTTGDGKGSATWDVGDGYPVISNAPLDFSLEPNIWGTGDPQSGIWLPRVNVPATASLVDNFSLENVHVIGGGRGAWSTGYDTTYGIYIVSTEQALTNYLNKNISFKGCTFDSNRGGTAILRSCRLVEVSGCTFRNANPTSLTSAGGNMAPLEGITFSSRASSANVLDNYEDGTEDADGEVLISNCIFEGRLYGQDESDLRYPANGRGWINFTPNYLGQDVNVVGCNFRGDVTGTNANHPESWRKRKWGVPYDGSVVANPITSTGIVNCSPFNIGISGCEFHTMRYAIITQIGFVSVDSCNFWNCETSITVRPEINSHRYNYARFSGYVDGTATWLAGTATANFWNAAVNTSYAGYYRQPSNLVYPDTYFKTKVSNCSFMKGSVGVNVGLPYWRDTGEGFSSVIKDYRSTLNVQGCSFDQQSNAAISFKDCNLDTQTTLLTFDPVINENWGNISVDSCDFSAVPASVKFYGKLQSLVKDHKSIYSSSDHRLVVKTFNYTNNKHTWCEYDGRRRTFSPTNILTDTNAGALAFIVGQSVIAHGNIFKDCYNLNGVPHSAPGAAVVSDYEISPVLFALVGENGTNIADNIWDHCVPTEDSKISTALQIGLAGAEHDSLSGGGSLTYNEGPLISICGNEIDGRSARGVQNGVYISQVYPEGQNNMTGMSTTQAANSGVLDGGPHIRPKLEFKNNSFKLFDANFGLVSVQHANYIGTATAGNFNLGGGYSNFWEWYSADVSGNTINLNNKTLGYAGAGKAGSKQYGNDIGTNLTTHAFNLVNGGGVTRAFAAATSRYSFLGAANSAQPGTYVACVDLRRCFRGESGLPNYAVGDDPDVGSIVNVVNNNFDILQAGLGSTPANKDTQEIMGFRVSKFPMEINVRGNSFNRAPLYIKWSWLCPYHTDSSPVYSDHFGGSAINIKNNSFYNYRTGNTVDINPATGFGRDWNPDSLALQTGAGYMQVVFNGNSVRNSQSGTVGPATALNWNTGSGGVRLWHPALESWGQAGAAPAGNLWTLAGGFHVNQDNCFYLWKVEHNYLQDLYFRLTEDYRGGASTTFTTGELRYRPDLSKTVPASTWQHNSFLISVGSATGATTKCSIFGLDCSLVFPATSVAGAGRFDWTTPYPAMTGAGTVDDANRIQINFNYGVVGGLIVKADTTAGTGGGGDVLGT